MPRKLTLTVACPDRVGIVSAVSSLIAAEQGWITEASHYSDTDAQRFFMRYMLRAASLVNGVDHFIERFRPLAEQFQMDWKLSDSERKPRVVILVSRHDHCLHDILHRYRSGEYSIEIPCVISNHDDLRALVEWHGLRFEHVPVEANDKAAAFARIEALFETVRGDVMVLARYMQILPAELCRRLPGRIINIHHSFLPSFIGARPYHQAHERGVKLIGATCHYVTEDLDDGPIIEQDVIRVEHDDTPEDLVGYGRDIERLVLARGLRYHFEDRVLLNGRRTVVFR